MNKRERINRHRQTCKSKVWYKSRRKAWHASVMMYIHKGWILAAYSCPWCSGYHLTTKDNFNVANFPPEWIEEFEKWYGSPVLSTPQSIVLFD